MPRGKKTRGPSSAAEDCLSCAYMRQRSATGTQARSATGHVRYNYRHLAHEASHGIRYEGALQVRMQRNRSYFQLAFPPTLRFYDTLDSAKTPVSSKPRIDNIGKRNQVRCTLCMIAFGKLLFTYFYICNSIFLYICWLILMIGIARESRCINFNLCKKDIFFKNISTYAE